MLPAAASVSQQPSVKLPVNENKTQFRNQHPKNLFTLRQSESMNTLFESMLKQYREKQAVLTTQKTLRGKDMTSVFQHGKASAPEDDKIYVEDEVVEVPTLF